MDQQLQQYREEQKRKHEQLSHEGSATEPMDTSPPLSRGPRISPPPSTSSSHKVTNEQTSHAPSAPPASIYYPDLNTPSTPLYPNINAGSSNRAQEREDEELARRLQSQQKEDAELARRRKKEEEEGEKLARRLQEEEEEGEKLAQRLRKEEEEGEKLARRLQEEEEGETLARRLQGEEDERARGQQEELETIPIQQPASPRQSTSTTSTSTSTTASGGGGILSTLGSLATGLYNAYNAYSQASQQPTQQQQQQRTNATPSRPQQQQQPQRREGDAQRRQIESDEELARQMQEEENEISNLEDRGRNLPFRREVPPPPFQFRFRTGPTGSNYPFPTPFGYDEDDEEFVPPHADPLSQLRSINTLFRSVGMAPQDPLFQHLQELMQQTHRRNATNEEFMHQGPPLPRHRYAFPGAIFGVQGAENLPPELLNMMQGQSDTSYESLLDLAERLQPVSRGASAQQIDQLPTRTYTEGSMPQEQSKCGICLADYEPGEVLTSLPACLHSFHKECIDKWLQINKICPVCRAEITTGNEPPRQQQ